jgi:hypothetical protein
MENNSEKIRTAFELRLNDLKKRHQEVVNDTASIWYGLFTAKGLPHVPSLQGTGELPVTTVLRQINQHNEKLHGFFEAMALVDPIVLLKNAISEDEKEGFLSDLEKLLDPVEGRVAEIKKLVEAQQES